MRSLGLLALLAFPATARATCDGCCDLQQTLVGWSADGDRLAVVQSWEVPEQRELILRGGGRERRWSSFAPAGDPPICVPATPRVKDVRAIDVTTWKPLAAARLQKVDPAWRSEFAGTVQVVAVGERRRRDREFGDWQCTAWELRQGTRVVATFPRVCDGALPIGGAEVLGGYLQPGGRVALVKLALRHAGYRTEQRFVRVPITRDGGTR